MIELVVSTAALGAAAAILAAILPRRGLLMTAIAVGVLWFGLVLMTLGAAGLGLRTLRGEVLTGLSLGWLVVAGALAWRAGVRPSSLGERCWAGGTRAAAVLRNPAVGLAALLVVGTIAWRVVLALRLPVVDYDGWSYHLVFADVWIQHDALTLVPQRIWTAGYPADGELLSTWLMAFTHSDTFAGFTSILPIPIAIVAVTGLTKELGASARWAALAGLVFGMTPAMIAMAGSSYIDAAAVAFPVATWWLGLRVLRGDRSWSTVGLLGLAGGLAAGTKGTNVPLTVPILGAAAIALLLPLWQTRRSTTRLGPAHGGRAAGDQGVARSWIGRLVLLAVPVLVLGGVWYVRNWTVFGNPLYPFAIGPWAGPTTLVDFAVQVPQLEHYPTLAQIAVSWAWDWGLTHYLYNLRPGGIGRAWYPILLVAIVGGVWLLRRRRWSAVLLVILPAAATFLTMPMPWYARLSLFVPALGAALAGTGATGLAGLTRSSAAGSDGHATDRWRPITHLAALTVVGLAAISLIYVNIKPNTHLLSPNGTHVASPGPYLRFLLADDAVRADIGLRRECAGFAQIPAGARVAPGGFNLLHGVVGPNLGHVLTDPLPPVTDAAALIDAMRATDATWLVTSDGGDLDRLAAQAGAALVDHGLICRGGHLWELAGSAS